MKNDLKTAGNRPKKNLVFKLRSQSRCIPLLQVARPIFADRYFSSLLKEPVFDRETEER